MKRQRINTPGFTRREMLGIGGGALLLGGMGFRPRRVAGQGGQDGRLVIGKPYEITGFDPHLDATQTSWEIHALIYESLILLDDQLVPVPWLAERWEMPDETTYVFTIRQGIEFHNGRAMTAEDVAFSLNRVLNPETASWWADKLSPVSRDDSAAPAVTVEVTGEFEVAVRLTAPYAPFLQALAGTTTAIVPGQEVASGEIDLSRELVGTGPYVVVDHAEDQHWEFARFDNYWRPGEPAIDQLVWRIMPDESSRVAALRAGDIQLTMFENPVMLDLVEPDPTIDTHQQLTTNLYLLLVNGNQPGLEDARVRQAISLGLDRQQLVDLGLFGRSRVSGPVPAGFVDLATPINELPFYERDVERARELLAEAGYGDGLTLTLHVTSVLAATIPMAEVIREQLAEIGIEIEILQQDLSAFINDYVVEGNAPLAIPWWAGYSDPYLMLSQISSEGAGSILGIDQLDELDRLLAVAAETVDPEQRLDALRELEATIAAGAYFQGLATRDNFIAWRSDRLDRVAFADADGFGLPLRPGIQQIELASR
jgi:peptide/nickel transport system substrate-binding protein